MAKRNQPDPEAEVTRPLPGDPLTERMVLGGILVSSGERQRELFEQVCLHLEPGSFSLENHNRIFSRMKDLHEKGSPIDRITLIHELNSQGQLQAVGGMTAISELDEGMPEVVNVASYCLIVKEAAEKRRLIFLGQKLIDRAWIAQEPAIEIAAGLQQELQAIESSRISVDDGGRNPEQIITEFPGGIEVFLDPSKQIRGLPTGFTRLDDMTGGLHPGEVVVVAARPSMGKSALVTNIVEYLALAPRLRKHCAIFSFEMSKAAIMTRMICSLGRVDQMKFRAGYLNSDDRRRVQEAVFQLTEARIDFYDRSAMKFPEIAAVVRRKVRDEGLHLVAIDYLQLIESTRTGEYNRNQGLSDISRGLKILAVECGIPIVVLSQLSRAVERRPGASRPMLSDLRDSGAIESDADGVWFIYREEMYKRTSDDSKGKAEVIVGKNRSGPTGIAKLKFEGRWLKFMNLTEEEDTQGEETT